MATEAVSDAHKVNVAGADREGDALTVIDTSRVPDEVVEAVVALDVGDKLVDVDGVATIASDHVKFADGVKGRPRVVVMDAVGVSGR